MLRNLLHQIERHRGLTHRRTRGEHDHFAFLETVGHLVEFGKTGANSHETLAFALVDEAHGFVHKFLRASDDACLALLRDAENLLLRVLQQRLRRMPRSMRLLKNLACGRDEFARRGLLAHHSRPVHGVGSARHAFGKLHEVVETTHRFNEIAIKEKLIEQNKINRGVTIVEFDHRVVDARVTRHREIISTANHRDDIADHLGIPQNCAQQAHFGFDRDWWRGREECSDIASLRFVRKIGTSEL